MKYRHNRNETFMWSGQLVNHHTNKPIKLAEFEITSEIKSIKRGFITKLIVDKNDSENTVTIRAPRVLHRDSYNWTISLTKDNVTNTTASVLLEVIND